MERLIFIAFLILSVIGSCESQKATLQERLGYQNEDKLLIIHADDLGVSHSENIASISAFEKGIVNSGSIMVPCPWFPEIANYAATHQEIDLGLHLTLTAEWKEFKWGPISGRSEVPGLVNEQGYFYDNCADVITHASVAEVEIEITSQIEKALNAGVPVTHLDSHMGCLLNPKFFSTYLKVSRKYKLPSLITISGLRQFPGIVNTIQPTDVVIGDIKMLYPGQAPDGVASYYADVLRNLEPGVNEILIHLARFQVSQHIRII